MLQATILGLIQGITEFLPISSSGHLVLFQDLLNTDYGAVFDVLVHSGTLLATLIYFLPTIRTLSADMVKKILLASIPAGLVGIFLNSYIEQLFSSPKLVGIGLAITTIFLFSTKNKSSSKSKITYNSSLTIGFAQALAIIPGISRSGSTISTAINKGIDTKSAFSFSFLLSMPAIAGATLISLNDATWSQSNISIYFAGFISAAVSGYLALKILKKALDNSKFHYFGYYTGFLSLITLLLLS